MVMSINIFMMLETKTKFNTAPALISIFVLIACFCGILYTHKNSKLPELKLTPQDTTIHFNEKIIKAFSLGQHRLLSSFLWSETLLKSDIKHYQKDDLHSWMFLRLKLITTLDPYFYIAYLYGAVYLSIVKDDLVGASYIYEKGLDIYPDDFHLNFNAGFHFYYEVGDYPKAIKAFENAKKSPKSPPHLLSLLSRLKASEGSLEDAFLIIRNLYEAAPDDTPIKKKYEDDLFSIKTEMDLDCLNRGLNNCSQNNPRGVPYQFKDNQWISPVEWTPYRIKKGKKSK